MPFMALTLYCTQDDLEIILSPFGVRVRADDDQDDAISPKEQTIIEAARTEGTEEVNLYLWDRYSPDMLAMSHWVNMRAAHFGACFLCAHRGNPIPESLADRCDNITSELERIQAGSLRVPGLPLRNKFVPVWSNTRADARYRWKVLRKEIQTSSQQPSSRPSDPDWAESMSFEW